MPSDSAATTKLWRRNGYLWDPVANQYEHRLIMERHLGRTLSFTEVVHHKDGNRANNKLSNLELTNRHHHMTNHRVLTKADADAIRRRLRAGETGSALAKEYGVGIATISRVKHKWTM